VAGLYAEGRIDAESSNALMLPESAMVKAGDKTYTWRVKGGLLERSTSRSARATAHRQLRDQGGLAAGDTVLRNPSSNLKDGQKVEMARAKAPAASAAPRTPQIIRELSHVPVQFQRQEADRDDRADPGDDVHGPAGPVQAARQPEPGRRNPVIVVDIPYPGASPETSEREIINRLEKQMQAMQGVTEVASYANEGSARSCCNSTSSAT
jgi:hypothetical protein